MRLARWDYRCLLSAATLPRRRRSNELSRVGSDLEEQRFAT